MSTAHRPCQRTRVATRATTTIDTCTCGTIHLNTGATTLRFTADGFEELAELVLEALAELTGSGHVEERLLLEPAGRVRGQA